MRITLTRHGGLLAGMKRPPRIIDIASLDPARAERLRTLVAKAIGAQRDPEAPVFADVPAGARSAMADAMSYSIAIEDEGVSPPSSTPNPRQRRRLPTFSGSSSSSLSSSTSRARSVVHRMVPGRKPVHSGPVLVMSMPRVRKAVRSPRKAARVLLALARGHWYKAVYRLRGMRFEAGRNFRVFGKLSIKGPGVVRFGDDVVVGMTVTPWTYEADAVIDIGDGTFLNGAQFGCAHRIVVGPRSILAAVSIMDTNFHSTDIDRHDDGARVRTAPVVIGANVWIAARAGILPGTTIGDNSVVGFGAVCSGEYPANALIGSPRAAVLRQIG
jgi:acetyltransferase-like isoleucine patch superfamily enzyme